jgi:hypothetical protein
MHLFAADLHEAFLAAATALTYLDVNLSPEKIYSKFIEQLHT